VSGFATRSRPVRRSQRPRVTRAAVVAGAAPRACHSLEQRPGLARRLGLRSQRPRRHMPAALAAAYLSVTADDTNPRRGESVHAGWDRVVAWK
jgi:hypothetical protein